MLSKSKVKKIGAAVDSLFQRVKDYVLGYKTDRKITVGVIPEMYKKAVSSGGGTPNDRTLNTIDAIVTGYLSAQKEKTKALIVRDVVSAHSESERSGTDFHEVLGSKLAETWDKTASDLTRIIDSETQSSKAMGLAEAVTRMAANSGVDDPTVYFVVVRDKVRCKECTRLHLLPDETTPRVWKMSEVGAGFHKKGEDKPCMSGLHPHCRCSLTYLPPGWGFRSGLLHYVGPNHDEVREQRG